MAIITEYQDQIDPPGSPSKSRPKSKPEPEPPKPKAQPQASNPPRAQSPNPFTFWFYFTVTVSLITLLFVFLSSLSPQDPKTWFLSLPKPLRDHFSNGRPVKVQINRDDPATEVFTYSQGSRSSENVLIVHGLGCSSFSFRKIIDDLASKGVFAVAIDLPGSGFSDKTVVKERERVGGGVFGRFLDVYDEIREKGIFWHFDNLIEHGHLPVDEGEKTRVSTRKVVEPLELGSQEVGRVLGQVVDSMGLAPLHLVLHDSALVMGANWVVENAGSLRSLTLIDPMHRGTALPLWAFEIPVIREVVLGVDYVFRRLIDSCCSKMVAISSVEAHRVLLKGRDGKEAIVGIGKKLNQSFDLVEWANTDALKSMPVQLLWSKSWSEEWSEEGRRVAEVVSQAKFIKHSGGRWPQVMDIKRLNNMMSEHGMYSRERMLIPLSNPNILMNSTCYIELDMYAKREVAVMYLDGGPPAGKVSVSGYSPSRVTSDHGKKRVIESLRRSMQVDDGTAHYYLSISNGDPRAALSEFSQDLGWERHSSGRA